MSFPHFKNFRKIEVFTHDPAWRITFLKESKMIALAMGEKAVTVHPIGEQPRFRAFMQNRLLIS
jgi:GrpB-like predicted nucleotidyltransferase (UPF0157 family)